MGWSGYMLPKGNTTRERYDSKKVWNSWREHHRATRPHVVHAAERLVELLSARLGPRGVQVRYVASKEFDRVLSETRLTGKEVQDILSILARCWHYGHSLRVWAIREGHITKPPQT